MFDFDMLSVSDKELEALSLKFAKKFSNGINTVARNNPPLGYAYSEDMCNAFAFGANCMHELMCSKMLSIVREIENKTMDVLDNVVDDVVDEIMKAFPDDTFDDEQPEEKPVPAECVKRAAQAEKLENENAELPYNVTMFRVVNNINRGIFAFMNQDDITLGRHYLKKAVELLDNHMVERDLLEDNNIDIPDCDIVRMMKGHIISAYRLLAVKEKEKAIKHLNLVQSLVKRHCKPVELRY